jgi:cobalt-zinc-cadmium efflux system outer membrane protein
MPRCEARFERITRPASGGCGHTPMRRAGARLAAGATVMAICSAAPLAIAAEPFPALEIALDRARARASANVAARGALHSAAMLRASAELPAVANPYLEIFADEQAAGRPVNDLAFQANLWIPIELSGQRGRRIQEVDRLTAWRTSQVADTAAETSAHLVRRYGAALAAAARVRVLETVVETSQQEAKLYDARVAAGDATIRDGKLAAVELSRNRMSLSEARGALERALAEVAALTGAPSLAPPADLASPPETLWRELARDPSSLVDQSPSVRTLAKQADYYEAVEAHQAAEAHVPVDVIVSGGRTPEGAARIGGGLAWTFPLLRRNQGERAHALAERDRARDVAQAHRAELAAVLAGLASERQFVRQALDELRKNGEPAAQAAVDAALATERIGKGDLLHVVAARRDLLFVRASGLTLTEREWGLLADLVALVGRSP